MKQLTAEEQALYQKGVEAEALLTNPAMASAINELSDNITSTLLATNRDESEKRERMYFLHNALKELVAILNHRVAVKQNLDAAVADDTETN
jgi:hypothetical protein